MRKPLGQYHTHSHSCLASGVPCYCAEVQGRNGLRCVAVKRVRWVEESEKGGRTHFLSSPFTEAWSPVREPFPPAGGERGGRGDG